VEALLAYWKRGVSALQCLFVTGLLVLAGCTGSNFQQFAPQSESIRTIALLTVPNPSAYQVVDWGGKASLFGAVGGAAVQMDARGMGETFGAAAKAANFDFGGEMQLAVMQSLKRAGFNMLLVPASRQAPEKLLPDYSNIPSAGADAFLDIGARVVGYSSYNLQDSDFRPHLHVDVRLVSAKTKAVLYSEQILFGYHNPYISATQLPSDKQYYYKDFNALMASKPKALEGLKRGVEAVADHIAARLKI
jgi:hypothetical protein